MTNDSNSNFSARYIQKYLEGQLTEQEMQALEKQALDDPFLADAIEGMEAGSVNSPAYNAGLEDLQARLAARISQPKTKRGMLMRLSGWTVAASLLLVTGFSFLILKNNKIKKNNLSSITATDRGLVTTEATLRDSVAPPSSANAASANAGNTNAERKIALSPKRPGTEKTSEYPAPAHSTTERNSPNASADQARSAKVTPAPRPAAVTSAPEYRKDKEAETEQSAKAESDVAKVQPETVRKKDITGAVSGVEVREISDTASLTGWQKFVSYINAHKKISTADSVWKGKEKLSFILNKRGDISDIKISNSLSPSHDEKISSLIMSAPTLELREGKKKKIDLVITFK